MKIAYLMNTYPAPSATFIRREIAALEEEGAEIVRFAVRRFEEPLVEPRDRAEAEKVRYLLEGDVGGLLSATFQAAISSPPKFVAAARLAFRLWRRARDGFVRHIAYLMEAASLATAAKAEGVSHIHAHFSTNTAAVAMLAEALGGPSYSFTVHGPDELFEARALSLDEKVARARFVVAITSYCRSQIMLFAGTEHRAKIHVVACGVPLEEFTALPPARGSRRLVCVGRLTPQKGQELLPAAMARVRRDFPDATLDLVGDGPTRSAIEAEIEKQGVRDAVRLLGWRSNQEVAAMIGDARALVLPTFAEGLPIVIMETFARARPVVTTYIAGIPELVDAECGWIAPAGDEEALGEALVDVLRADEARLAALGAEGRARVEARHDLHANARALKTLLARCA